MISIAILIILDILLITLYGWYNPLTISSILLTIISIILGILGILKTMQEVQTPTYPTLEINMGEKNKNISYTEATEFLSTLYNVDPSTILIRNNNEYWIPLTLIEHNDDSYIQLQLIKEYFGAKDVKTSTRKGHKTIQITYYSEVKK